MWSIDDILTPLEVTVPTPPQSPGLRLQPLPGGTPRRAVRSYPRFHPYSFQGQDPWTSKENFNPLVLPPCWMMPPAGPPPAAKQLTPSMTPSPSKSFGELDFNSTTPCKSRFATPLKAEELQQVCKPFVPRHTKNNNSWATGVFKAWVSIRNASVSVESVPINMLEMSYPLSVIDRTLAAFVCEARRADGKPHPGSTLKNILSVLFRVMKQFQGAQNLTNFVDKTEREKHFPQLHNR